MLRVNLSKDQIDIDGRGFEGIGGHSGHDGSSGYTDRNGQKGEDGSEGTDGGDAHDVKISLSANESLQQINVALPQETPYQIPLGETSTKIKLTAIGGDGGNGGKGGRGGRGGDGSSGHNATPYSSGSNGHDGGHGGDGGNGGRAGHGGNGGIVTVEVAEDDTDLLMLVQPNVSRGRGGKGGAGGEGGAGGRGGSGGSSYMWNEVHHTTDHEGHTQMHTITHIEPGGSSGSSGHSGRQGSHGANGRDGRDGQYKINVKGLGSYQSRYDIVLNSFEPIISDDNVIEPEESLTINHLEITNTSKMPTPSKIQMEIKPNKWVSFDARDHLATAKALLPGQSITFEDSLEFTIQPNACVPTIDATFNATTNVQVQAKLPRVNQCFENLLPKPITVAIRYPVEMSIVSNAHTITRNEEAPFAIKLRNISSKPIGSKTKESRDLQFTLKMPEKSSTVDLAFIDQAAKVSQILSQPYQQNVPYLAPGESITFAGTLKFIDPMTPAYTQANLAFDLQLGKLREPTVQTIQTRNFQVQLADNYEYVPEADFVLVTNQKIAEKTVDEWQKTAGSFGSRLSIWNTSLYSGLSYTKKRMDNESFVSQLQNKVLIILNNNFSTDTAKKTNSTDFLDQMEIFEAAKSANISTYVVGEQFNVEKAALPLKKSNASMTTKTDNPAVMVMSSFIFWRKPKPEHLMKEAAKLNNKLRQASPTERTLAVVEFKPVKLKSYFIFNKWQLGQVQFRSALDRNKTHIAHRDGDANEVNSNDIYNILKLLPFNKKLTYLAACIENQTHLEILESAILADLTDELRAFGYSTWRGKFSQERLSSALEMLNQLQNTDFSKLCRTSTGHDCLSRILLTYEYLVKKLPGASDKYVFPMFKLKTMLSNIELKKITKLLNLYFPGEDFSAKRNQIQQEWKEVKKEVVLKSFTVPKFAGYSEYDNQNKENQVIEQSKLPVYKPSKSTFQEGKHFFNTHQEREKGISEQADLCQFDLGKP